jgi:hypothetical protein
VSRATDTFIRHLISSKTYHLDGEITVTKDPAVWTLAHRGYSTGGRLDIWVYPTKQAALLEGARLALACGMDEDPKAQSLFAKGQYAKLLELYEQTRPEDHLLRVQPAFLQYSDTESVDDTAVPDEPGHRGPLLG